MSERPVFDCEAVRDLAGLAALGALEPEEAEAVRAHVATCAVGHPEVLLDAAVATALLETVEPVEPPAALRGRILAAAEADLWEGRHPAGASARPAPGAAEADLREGRHPAGASAQPAPGAAEAGSAEPAVGPSQAPARRAPDDSPIPFAPARARRRRLSWAGLAAAAAIVVAVGLGAWNLSLRGQLSSAEAYRSGVEAALELASRPGSATALLAGGDGTVSGLGVVGADGTVRLAMQGLGATSGSQVYTAWAIGGDGVPVNIGEFTAGADGTAVAIATAANAQPGVVLALTLEPTRGATTPTMPIVASGETRPASG